MTDKMKLREELELLLKHHRNFITDGSGNQWEVVEASDIENILEELSSNPPENEKCSVCGIEKHPFTGAHCKDDKCPHEKR